MGHLASEVLMFTTVLENTYRLQRVEFISKYMSDGGSHSAGLGG